MDQEGLGRLDLPAVINAAPAWLDDLDDEVRSSQLDLHDWL